MSRRSSRPGGARRLPAAAVVALAYAAGSVPFSNLMARGRLGVDLRDVGSGTVSGSGLYRVGGFAPMAVAGVADVAKGSVGPLLAGPERPVVAAVATAAGIVAHDWSPWLGGAGGRGISPALGALLVRDRWGVGLMAAALGLGGALDQEGATFFAATAALPAVLGRLRGRDGALVGTAIAVPMLTKRLLGNRPPARRDAATYLARLVLDQDDWHVTPDDPAAPDPHRPVPSRLPEPSDGEAIP